MDSISQLNQYHPDILRHRQEHLAEVLRFRMLLRFKLDLVDLADTINQ